MKKKNKIALGILSSILFTGGIVASALYIKNKYFKRYNYADGDSDDDDYIVQDDDGLAYGFYEFETVEEMNRAIYSNLFNVDAYYEVDNKGYLVVLLDGNEDKLYKYRARKMNANEANELLIKTEVASMYFYFEDQENLLKYSKTVSRIIPGKNKFQTVIFQDAYYINVSDTDPSLHDRLRIAASEFYGEEVKDMYIANRLKECFDLAK